MTLNTIHYRLFIICCLWTPLWLTGQTISLHNFSAHPLAIYSSPSDAEPPIGFIPSGGQVSAKKQDVAASQFKITFVSKPSPSQIVNYEGVYLPVNYKGKQGYAHDAQLVHIPFVDKVLAMDIMYSAIDYYLIAKSLPIKGTSQNILQDGTIVQRKVTFKNGAEMIKAKKGKRTVTTLHLPGDHYKELVVVSNYLLIKSQIYPQKASITVSGYEVQLSRCSRLQINKPVHGITTMAFQLGCL